MLACFSVEDDKLIRILWYFSHGIHKTNQQILHICRVYPTINMLVVMARGIKLYYVISIPTCDQYTNNYNLQFQAVNCSGNSNLYILLM